MKRLWAWFRGNQDAQFGVGSIVVIIVVMFFLFAIAGCASLNQPAIFPEEIAPTQEQQDLCALVYEHVRWMMARAGVCAGWVKL